MSRYTRFPKSDAPEKPAREPETNRFSRAGNESPNSPGTESSSAATVGGTDQATQTRTGPLATSSSTIVVTLFLISLAIPVQIFVGSLLLTPTRLFLLLMFLPAVFRWASGSAGRLYGLDFVFLAFVFWMGITLFIAHGTLAIDLVGITAVETLGAYFLGRVFVRSAKQFDGLMKILAIIMMALIPAAVLESLTGFRIYSEIADVIGRTHNWVHADGTYEKRLGMYRAHTVFEHPILFGVFSATVFSLLFYSQRSNGRGNYGYRRAWLSIAGTFFSLSSGAILSLAAQMGLRFWDWSMRGFGRHWRLLIILIAVAYVIVDLLSNRTPMEVFISYAAFSAHNGYMRIVIFTYGMENVWAHPIFGIGQGDWIRPRWMQATSVDNFWLLMGMRHGFPGFILIAWTFLGMIVRLAQLELKDKLLRDFRYALVFSLIGLALALMTVHIWGVTYIFVCFLLGAGMWLRDAPDTEDNAMDSATGATDTDTRRRAGARSRQSVE